MLSVLDSADVCCCVIVTEQQQEIKALSGAGEQLTMWNAEVPWRWIRGLITRVEVSTGYT